MMYRQYRYKIFFDSQGEPGYMLMVQLLWPIKYWMEVNNSSLIFIIEDILASLRTQTGFVRNKIFKEICLQVNSEDLQQVLIYIW